MADNVLNFFKASFSSTAAKVWAGRRHTVEYREHLEREYPTWTAWPDPTDADRLYLWCASQDGSSAPSDFVPVTVELNENPFLFERLLQDAVEKRLSALGFNKRGYRDFVNFSKGNLLEQIEPLSAALQEPIGIYPKIVVDAFFTSFSEDQLLMGLVVDVLYTTQMDIPLDEVLSAGVDLRGKSVYVKLLEQSPEGGLHPDLVGLTVGRVAHIENGWVELEDHREPGLTRVRTSSVVLEPRREHLDAYLGARYEYDFERGKPLLGEKFRKLICPAEKHRLIKGLVSARLMGSAEGVNPTPLQLLAELSANLDEMLHVPTEVEFSVTCLQPPTYSFDPTGTQFRSGRVDDGLRACKPYSKRLFRGKEHHILVISPDEYKGTVQQAVAKLRKGLRVPGSKVVFTGLENMYDLRQLHICESYFSLQRAAPMRSYQDALQAALIDAGRKGVEYKLALIVTQDSFRQLSDSENPYYQCKAFLLSSSPAIPTQNMTIEKLRSRDYELQYILNTASLACYAKMGGTPFVLKTPEAGPCELVFGVGRSVVKESRYGTGEQTIGFSTVFRANGEYIYNDCTPYCDISDYSRHLEITIRRAVERVAGFEQLQDGAELRLVFHIFKSTGKKEVRAITNAIGKLTRYQIEYALVHVNEDHPFYLFDLHCEGVMRKRDKKQYNDPSAALIPKRGTVVNIGPRERLIVSIGPDQYRGSGCPSPIRMTMDKTSTFKDVDYLARQLFDLSFMNARSLNPSVKPVTILYSEFLANLVGHLRGVQQWSVQLIQQKLGQRLWFI